MSYNISGIEIVASNGFCITREAWERIGEALDEQELLPEGHIFDDDWFVAGFDGKPGAKETDAGEIFPKTFWWHGEGSGGCFDALVADLLPAFKGSADLVVIWEGGDSFSGLRVKDGLVVRHKVVMQLGEPEGP
jgi:hypothetical protein